MTTSPRPGAHRHWWSLAEVPLPANPISTRRAYAEVLGVYLAFFGASIVVAAGTQASFTVTNPEGWWVTGSDGFDEVAQAALALTLVLLLASRRGRRAPDLGLVGRRSSGGPGLRQGIRMAAWAASAFLVGGYVTSVLATGHFPFGHTDTANTVLDLSAALNAGLVEETVVLAFLVTTLEQARRPRLEIAAVALICRGAYHIYYGPGALGILVWASVFLWLFWRFRSVVPLIITHVCWDSLVFLGHVSSAYAGLLVLLILALLVTAVVLWLVDRSGPGDPAPQWQPDRTAWAPPAWEGPSGGGPPWSGPPPRDRRGATQNHWGVAATASPPRPPPAPAPVRPDSRDGWGPPAGA